MPKVQCSFPDCPYTTDDLPAELVLKLLDIHAGSHATPPQPTIKIERVRRPTISSAGTSEEWQYFQTRWGEYVAATKISGTDRVIQLLECCDDQLRKDLTHAAGKSLTTQSEEEVLRAIKRLAVREENIMVARVALHDMRQDNDETICSFGARIHGQANVCQYNTACPSCSTTVDFTDCILQDVLARGIADNEIQLDLLGDAKQDMTLEEMLKFVESKESGKRSASCLHDYSKGPQTAAASSYNWLRRQAHKDRPAPPNGEHILCSYCGKKGHGLKSPTSIRTSECPAFNHTCKHCNHLHHFETICRSKNKAKPAPLGRSANTPCTPAPSTDENAVFTDNTIFDHPSNGVVFDSLCSLSLSSSTANNSGQCSISLDHHTYNQLTDTWVRQASKPQPFIKVTATISTSDYTAFGLTIIKPTTPVTFSAIADTGCQSCLAGISAIHRLGMTRKDLIPVTLQMHAANSAKIAILGAAILQFSGQSNSSKTLVTRQLVYITDSTDKVFLSREACTDLGLISRQFRSIGKALFPPDNTAISHASLAQQPPVITKQEAPQHDSGLTAPCDCPK